MPTNPIGPPRALGTKLARAFLGCSGPAAVYGACIRANVEQHLQKNICAKQFEQLKKCIQQQAK